MVSIEGTVFPIHLWKKVPQCSTQQFFFEHAVFFLTRVEVCRIKSKWLERSSRWQHLETFANGIVWCISKETEGVVVIWVGELHCLTQHLCPRSPESWLLMVIYPFLLHRVVAKLLLPIYTIHPAFLFPTSWFWSNLAHRKDVAHPFDNLASWNSSVPLIFLEVGVPPHGSTVVVLNLWVGKIGMLKNADFKSTRLKYLDPWILWVKSVKRGRL